MSRHLELQQTSSDFDEAVIVIDGHEEETILVECANAHDLAAEIVAMFNRREHVEAALRAAFHALRSYQHGNAATDLARSVADYCAAQLKRSA